MAEDLVLDMAIRDWVLIPLSVVMVLIRVLRYFVSKLMRSSQVPDAKIIKEGLVHLISSHFIPSLSLSIYIYDCVFLYLSDYLIYFLIIQNLISSPCWWIFRQVIIRARNLRAAANFIPFKSFRARRVYFSNEVCFYSYYFVCFLSL